MTEISNTNSSADIINQHVFTYNTLDLRSSETISGSALPAIPSLPEETVDYAYNTVNQLLSVTNPNLTFVYDDDGNMTQGYVGCSPLDGGVGGYSPLEGGIGGCYPFTATYDAEDRMTSLEYTDSSSVVHRTEYQYSGDGFLAIIRKFENSSLVDETRIVRDGLLAVQERDGSNNVVREYTWGLNLGGGIGGLLNLKQGGQDYSYLYDGKGNVAAVLDGNQAVVAAYRYAPFGKLLATTGTLDQPFGFSTKRYDEQTGLIHYLYRSYAPEIGRWTTRDPLGEAGGMNLYAFVGNNPVNWGDPLGLLIVQLSEPTTKMELCGDTLTSSSMDIWKVLEKIKSTSAKGKALTDALEKNPFVVYKVFVAACDTYEHGAGRPTHYDPHLVIIDKCYDPSIKTDQGQGKPSFERILVHELGHFVGGGDEEHIINTYENPIMFPIDNMIRIPE